MKQGRPKPRPCLKTEIFFPPPSKSKVGNRLLIRPQRIEDGGRVKGGLGLVAEDDAALADGPHGGLIVVRCPHAGQVDDGHVGQLGNAYIAVVL